MGITWNNEAELQAYIGRSLRKGLITTVNGFYEAKLVKSGNFRLGSVEEGQWLALGSASGKEVRGDSRAVGAFNRGARERGLYFKMGDDSRARKPCDFFWFARTGAFIIVGFNSGARLISVDARTLLAVTGGLGTISYERLMELGIELRPNRDLI